MKKNESPIDTIIRQTKEETGLDAIKEDVYGLGKEGQLEGVPDSRGYKYQIFPNVIKKDPIKKINQVYSQEDDVRQKCIQSWVLIKDPKDPLFLSRKRNNSGNEGKIVALVRIQDLYKIINEFREQNKWSRKQIKKEQEKIQNPEVIIDLDVLKQLDGKLKFRISKESYDTQYEIKKMSHEQRDKFINLIQNYVCELLHHLQGNYIIQVLFEQSDTSQRQRLLKKICPRMHKIITVQCGKISCSKIIDLIDVEKQTHLFEVVFNGIFQNFLEISKIGFKIFRHVIKYVPVELLLKLNKRFIGKLEIFTQLIKQHRSMLVLQDILLILHKSSNQNNENVKKMKQKMIKNLGKCLKQVFSTYATHFIRQAYQILTPEQMETITKKLFRNLQNLLQQKVSFWVVRGCVQRYWNKPFYVKYYHDLGKRITQIQIQQMFNQKFGNTILRKILMIDGQFQIKDKITNYVMDRPIKGNPQNRQNWMIIMKKLRDEYKKVDGVWVRNN